MSKQQSLQLKGVAIIMMLLYHLFYVNKFGGEYITFLNIGGVSLLKRFSEICYPVTLYVMLSGYGLYASYVKNGGRGVWKRTFKLYLHLWLILLVFIPLGCYLRPDKYPGDLCELLLNVLSLESSYNTEQWFLLPYLLLMMSSTYFFRLIDKVCSWLTLGVALLLSVIYVFLYHKYGAGNIREHIGLGINLFFIMSFLFPFSIGALARKHRWMERLSTILDIKSNDYGLLSWGGVFLMIVLRLLVPNQSLQPFFVAAIFMMFPLLKISQKAEVALEYLGRHSLNVWLIHTWLCYYLFKDFIYGFKYSILIFAATLLGSLVVSHLVMFLYRKISKYISL